MVAQYHTISGYYLYTQSTGSSGVRATSSTTTAVPVANWTSRWYLGASFTTAGIYMTSTNIIRGYLSDLRVSTVCRQTPGSEVVPSAALTTDGSTVFLNSFDQTGGSVYDASQITPSLP